VPSRPGLHGDITDTHYVDPAPYLVRATVAAPPSTLAARRERHHALKSAF